MKKIGKIILIIIAAMLVAVALGIYYLQIKEPKTTTQEQTDGNVLSQTIDSQTPTFKKASITGSVINGSQAANGSVEIGQISYPLKDGKFTVANFNSGVYSVLYLDENGKEHKLTPPSMQIFPGENSSLEFSVNP